MNRRTFVKNSIPLLAMPALVKGIPLTALAGSLIESAPVSGNKIMVIIELTGGNDGLNTIIPIDQYKNLLNARGNIIIPERKIIPLNGSNTIGLHPSLKPLQSLYKDKMMAIVQGVGYPNFNYSHYRASDIMQTASGAGAVLPDGFLGRYLAGQNPQYPNGYPNRKNPDPLAIGVGKVRISTSLQANGISMGMAVSGNSDFFSPLPGLNMEPPPTNSGSELEFTRQTASLASLYGKGIKQAINNQQGKGKGYPERNELAANLKLIAQLIGGGLQTPIYLTSLYPFDHHYGQVDSDDATKGNHASLLHQLAEAMVAFMDDLHAMGMQDKVFCMVNSEFGRRIKSNASYGTDHGSAQPFLFFGAQIKGGITGHNPVIPEQVSVADNLEMQYDYRSVYSTVLKKWFSASEKDVAASVPGSYGPMDLFR